VPSLYVKRMREEEQAGATCARGLWAPFCKVCGFMQYQKIRADQFKRVKEIDKLFNYSITNYFKVFQLLVILDYWCDLNDSQTLSAS
jgi:hypothetical protein